MLANKTILNGFFLNFNKFPSNWKEITRILPKQLYHTPRHL